MASRIGGAAIKRENVVIILHVGLVTRDAWKEQLELVVLIVSRDIHSIVIVKISLIVIKDTDDFNDIKCPFDIINECCKYN